MRLREPSQDHVRELVGTPLGNVRDKATGWLVEKKKVKKSTKVVIGWCGWTEELVLADSAVIDNLRTRFYNTMLHGDAHATPELVFGTAIPTNALDGSIVGTLHDGLTALRHPTLPAEWSLVPFVRRPARQTTVRAKRNSPSKPCKPTGALRGWEDIAAVQPASATPKTPDVARRSPDTLAVSPAYPEITPLLLAFDSPLKPGKPEDRAGEWERDNMAQLDIAAPQQSTMPIAPLPTGPASGTNEGSLAAEEPFVNAAVPAVRIAAAETAFSAERVRLLELREAEIDAREAAAVAREVAAAALVVAARAETAAWKARTANVEGHFRVLAAYGLVTGYSTGFVSKLREMLRVLRIATDFPCARE